MRRSRTRSVAWVQKVSGKGSQGWHRLLTHCECSSALQPNESFRGDTQGPQARGLRTGLICSGGSWGAYAWLDDKGHSLAREGGIGPVCPWLRPMNKCLQKPKTAPLCGPRTERVTIHPTSYSARWRPSTSHKWQKTYRWQLQGRSRKIMTWTVEVGSQERAVSGAQGLKPDHLGEVLALPGTSQGCDPRQPLSACLFTRLLCAFTVIMH